MKLIYKAVKNNGEAVSGTREAVDRFALAREMHAEGLTLISAEAEETKTKKKISWSMDLFNRVKVKDLIIFASSLQAMLAAGLPLVRTLEIIERQLKNKRFKKVVAGLNEQINRGESLSKAMADYPNVFPLVFVAMVEAGEESGQLPQSIEIVRQQLAKSHDLQRKVTGAMIYPAVIVTVILAIGALMMIFLVPTLTTLFKEMEVKLPLSTRIVIATSDFAVAYYPYLAVLLVAAIIGVIKFVRTSRGQRFYSELFLRLPVISSIVKNLNSAITMRTISSLISSGVNLLEALAITGKVLQNPFYKEALFEAGPVVEKGGTLSSVFQAQENIYPILVGEMTEVGEETGDLAAMLLKGAVMFEEDVDQATKNLATIIEPVLMVLMGLAVAFFAISIIGPIYSLTNAL
jgi:type IV pilus assembly protein PilC